MNTYIVPHVALSGTAESFHSKNLIFLHLCLVTALHDGHTLAAMDNMLVNVVTVQVPDTFHRVCRPVNITLVAFHDLLDSCTDITDADINSCFL